MKKFEVFFWRQNPQLIKGGYETSREIEARSLASAQKKADKIASNCPYGNLRILRIEEC